MVYQRIIACLDVANGRVVKGTKFVDLTDKGDPVELAKRYEAQGADELVMLDISATIEERVTFLKTVEQIAESIFIPLVIGGGIKNLDDITNALRSGAAKVAINSAAIADPTIISRAAAQFGSQCIVASIDVRQKGDAWEVVSRSGTTDVGLDAIIWAQQCVQNGAGEILMTSIDRDGTRIGYDTELLSTVRELVDVPLIASGGAGTIEDIAYVFTQSNVDGALLAGILHDGKITVEDIKDELIKNPKLSIRKVVL